MDYGVRLRRFCRGGEFGRICINFGIKVETGSEFSVTVASRVFRRFRYKFACCITIPVDGEVELAAASLSTVNLSKGSVTPIPT